MVRSETNNTIAADTIILLANTPRTKSLTSWWSLRPLYGGGYKVALLQVATVYYGIAILLHLVVPLLFRVRSVQVGKRRSRQALQEAINCAGPIAIKAAVLTAAEKLHAAGYGLSYSGWPQTPLQWLYLAVSVVMLDYFHDAWFFWTHRLLHSRALYRHVHALHHRSSVPTAFSGYSFHCAEAIIVFGNGVLEVFLVPLHVGLHRLYHLYTTIIHIGGHIGYELAPLIPTVEALAWAILSRGAPATSLNTVAHHDIHHRYPGCHFSLYFTHWDRWCSTQHPSYRHCDILQAQTENLSDKPRALFQAVDGQCVKRVTHLNIDSVGIPD